MPTIANSRINNVAAGTNGTSFSPTADFFVVVDAGEVALECQLPGRDVFNRVADLYDGTIRTTTFQPNTVTKVQFAGTGATYRLSAIRGPADAQAWSI